MIRKIDLDPRLGRLQGRILFDLFLKHLLLTSRKIKQNRKWFFAKLPVLNHCF